MFDAFKAHADFSIAVARLQINRVGTVQTGYAATKHELDGIGAYIEQICKLTADHIEAIIADANASATNQADESLARVIADTGGDIAGEMARMAQSMVAFERSRARA